MVNTTGVTKGGEKSDTQVGGLRETRLRDINQICRLKLFDFIGAI